LDRTQLIIIIVTAIISAVAKEIIAGLFKLFKKLSIGRWIKSKIQKLIVLNTHTTPIIIDLTVDVILFLVGAFMLYQIVRDPSPITRLTVLGISYWMFLTAYYFGQMSYNVGKYSYHVAHRDDA
jgi:hypothetical protein